KQPLADLVVHGSKWWGSRPSRRGAGSVVDRFRIFHYYDADSTPETFSFPPGSSAPALSIFGNRRGLNVYSGYLAGSLFDFDRNMLLYSQLALDRNDAVDRRVGVAGWDVEPGYPF